MERIALLVCSALFAASCGAKTGLDAPAPRADAGVDAAPPPPLCVEIPRERGPVRVALDLVGTLRVVDVFFLIDGSGSMVDEIELIRRRLRDVVVPRVRANFSSAAFGLSFLGEFPVEPHGPPEVKPYEMRQPITLDTLHVEAALENYPKWDNEDFPEAQVESLYQVATGEGLSPFIEPSLGCPTGGHGGACFRPEALPVIVLVTDAPMHDGPPDVPPIDPYLFEPRPHDYEAALLALRAIGARVIGIGPTDVDSPTPMDHLRAIALDTGTVDQSGAPLAFDVGELGAGVDDTVVSAVQTLAEGLPLDVDAVVEDVPGDAIDARALVVAVRPVAADPPSGVDRIEGASFLGVEPGTRLVFELVVDPSVVPPSDADVRVPAEVRFRAFERSTIERRRVDLVVLGRDGPGCNR